MFMWTFGPLKLWSHIPNVALVSYVPGCSSFCLHGGLLAGCLDFNVLGVYVLRAFEASLTF